MKILFDYREPEHNFKLLKGKNIEVEKVNLPIGDYVHEESSTVFERKEFADWVGSIKQGHIQKQIMQMCESFENVYIILIGNINSYLRFSDFNKWSVEQQDGSLMSVLTRYKKVKIIPVENNNQAMDCVIKGILKLTDGKVPTIYETELLKEKITVDDTFLRMIACIEGISIKKAQAIQQKFPTMLSLISCSKEQLKEIDGIGEKIATHIKEVIK